jgi:hydrogenase maturation factor
MAVEAADAERIVHALNAQGIRAVIIGQTTEATYGVRLHGSEGICDLPRFERDEIARLFD